MTVVNADFVELIKSRCFLDNDSILIFAKIDRLCMELGYFDSVSVHLKFLNSC